MRPSEIAKRIERDLMALGVDVSVDQAASGSVYLDITPDEDDLAQDIRVRISDHVHFGGGVDRRRDTNIEICTRRTGRDQMCVDGFNVKAAIIKIEEY